MLLNRQHFCFCKWVIICYDAKSKLTTIMMITMNKFFIGVGISSLLALTGCMDKSEDKQAENPISCTSAEATQSILDNIAKKAKQSALFAQGYEWSLSEEVMSQALSQLQIQITNIRTDVQSEKKATCLATYSIDVPSVIFKQANDGFAYWNEGEVNLTTNLAALNWVQEAASLNKNIQYTVQQTDDGKKVITELDKPSEVSDGLSNLLIGYGAYGFYTKMMEQDDKNEKEWAAREAQLQVLDDERTIAMVKESKELNRFAHQRMNQAWQSLPESVRKELLNVQNAWNEKRNKDCRYRATANTDNTPEQALIVIHCDTEYVDARTEELLSLASRYDNNEASEAEANLASVRSQMQQTWSSLPKEIRETLQQEQKEWQSDAEATCTSKRSQTADQESSRLIYNKCLADEIKKRIGVLKKFQV